MTTHANQIAVIVLRLCLIVWSAEITRDAVGEGENIDCQPSVSGGVRHHRLSDPAAANKHQRVECASHGASEPTVAAEYAEDGGTR